MLKNLDIQYEVPKDAPIKQAVFETSYDSRICLSIDVDGDFKIGTASGSYNFKTKAEVESLIEIMVKLKNQMKK